LVNKNVLSCLLKDGKEVNAVMLVGRLFHARATVTRNDRSPMVLSRVRGTIRRGQEPDRSRCSIRTVYNTNTIFSTPVLYRGGKLCTAVSNARRFTVYNAATLNTAYIGIPRIPTFNARHGDSHQLGAAQNRLNVLQVSLHCAAFPATELDVDHFSVILSAPT